MAKWPPAACSRHAPIEGRALSGAFEDGQTADETEKTTSRNLLG
jgi:hypothetical protein